MMTHCFHSTDRNTSSIPTTTGAASHAMPRPSPLLQPLLPRSAAQPAAPPDRRTMEKKARLAVGGDRERCGVDALWLGGEVQDILLSFSQNHTL